MDLIAILLLGVALSLDTFAVSLSLGFACEKSTSAQKVRFLLFIGLSHFLMILIGWFVGEHVSRFIADYDHWVAFFLLAFIGVKMIREGVTSDENSVGCNELLSLKNTLFLGIALSIDALVTGFSLGLVSVEIADISRGGNILLAALLIGLLAYCISAIGIVIGRKTGSRLGPKAEIIGGGLLVLIGIKILVEHMV